MVNVTKLDECADVSEYREKVAELESVLKDHDPIELEVRHHFAHGTYTRELFIPKGTMLTGQIHRHSCINIISKGKIIAFTDKGRIEIEAPHTFVSGSGVKKAGYALEDTIWLNVHPWDGPEDVELIEKEIVVSSYEQLEIENKEALWLG